MSTFRGYLSGGENTLGRIVSDIIDEDVILLSAEYIVQLVTE